MATDAPSSHEQPYRHYLREWREHRGLLQEELAKLAGTSKSVISRYETGDRRIHLAIQFRLMRALGIMPAQFFSPPGTPSLDALVANASVAERAKIVRMVEAFVCTAGDELSTDK